MVRGNDEPETVEVGGIFQWFGECFGCSGCFVEPEGLGALTVGGEEGMAIMQDVLEIDTFVCALGRLLGWQMPRGRVRGRLRLRRHRDHVRVTYVDVSDEHGKPVFDVLTQKEARHLFGWLCEHFGWEDASRV